MTRPHSEELDKILGQPIPVLDHGIIRVVDYMGNDSAVVQAARVSYGTGTKSTREDAGLINYLMRNRHTTPFEMCEIKWHIKLPIFVARQWIRHRTTNVNEYSARYPVLDAEYYIPTSFRSQDIKNKQGSGADLDLEESERIRQDLIEACDSAYARYLSMLSAGVSRELARAVLPVNFYTQWYWKIDLHNLLHFLNLRCDEHAQYEIRCYASRMSEIVRMWVPTVHEAWTRNLTMGETK